MPPPQFKTKVDQLVWYVKRFILYVVSIQREAHGDNPDYNEELISGKLDLLPPQIFLGWALEAGERFGKQLDGGDLSAVAKIMALASTAQTTEVMFKEATEFVQLLEADDEKRRKFFSYWKIIRQIIDA